MADVIVFVKQIKTLNDIKKEYILPTCVNRLAKYCGLFGDRVKTGRTVAGEKNEAKSHNKRKAVLRNLKRIREN